jgi:hypothetical protein
MEFGAQVARVQKVKMAAVVPYFMSHAPRP